MASPDSASNELAHRLVRGEEAAFTELYDACAPQLLRYATARLGADTAADAVQAAFLRAVKSRRQFRGVASPVAYLLQIVRNEVMRVAGRNRRQSHEALPPAGIADWRPEASYHDERELVTSALGRLESDDRELVELKIYGGLTFAEIAAVVDRPANTVATRYRRALESLRGWLEREFAQD